MYLNRVWELAQTEIFSLPSSEGLFNPYRDQEVSLDVPGAPELRRENFKQYLAEYEQSPALFLLAEAPGPWGCRFSGVPLVSESQLVDPEFPIHGRSTSLAPGPYSEYTANIYWRVLEPWFPLFFTWNTVPFHPYKGNELLSIRNPRNGEVKQFMPLIETMIELVNPTRILAIGRKAEFALTRLGKSCTYIRHPSQGGARKFEEGVRDVLKEMNLKPVTA